MSELFGRPDPRRPPRQRIERHGVWGYDDERDELGVGADPVDLSTAVRIRPGVRVRGGVLGPLMDRSDGSLLDFGTESLVNDDIEHARRLLGQQHDVYGNQLAIAKFIDGWIQRLAADGVPSEFNDGFAAALVEIRTHLRDGDLLDQSDPSL